MMIMSRESQKLLSYAADPARKRRGRGLRLNVPESTALITGCISEAARNDAMDGVPELVDRFCCSC